MQPNCKDCPCCPVSTPNKPGPPQGGLKYGELVVISAKTGVGKSILATLLTPENSLENHHARTYS